jgi:cytochrome c oxidase subunit I
VAILPFLWNVWITWRHGELVGNNPWGAGTLEWATTSPPPEHNFDALPPIRSERPVWDLDHPEARGLTPATAQPRGSA